MLLAFIIANILSLCMFMGDARVVEDIKLFDVIDLSGLTETPGYHSDSKAYIFTKTTGNLIAPANVSAAFAREAFLVEQFSVKTYLLAATNSNGGTIVFLSRGSKGGEAFSIGFNWKSGGGGDSVEIDAVFRFAKTGYSSFACKFENAKKIPRDEWLHLNVRISILEKLLRCEIKTAKGDTFYRNSIIDSVVIVDQPLQPFPLNGTLRMAQKKLPVSEHVPVLTERFVGKLQDVIISFGDPNCTIIIDDTHVPPVTVKPSTVKPSTVKPPIPTQCPTKKVVVKDDTCPGDGKKRKNGEKWSDSKNGECECKKGNTFCVKSVQRCVQGGKVYRDGDTWFDVTGTSPSCDQCRCDDGVVKCQSVRRTFRNGCDFTCDKEKCEKPKDGCYCPEDKVLLKGKCVNPISCPCIIRGKEYRPGSYAIGCDICRCFRGEKAKCARNVFC